MHANRNHISGWLALDKPEGISSARAVALVRRIFNAAKIGHAGTLDPMASGLLPIALGAATKTASFLIKSGKTYRFVVRLGIGTDSDDREGKIIATSSARPTDEAIAAHLKHFIGIISQIPPIFSAIKQNGRPAYRRARAGEKFHLPPRQVHIHDLRLVSRPDRDHLLMEMRCGQGVYVRAIARDLGQKLGCPAHIAQLRRLTVGNFCAEDMIILDKVKEIGHSASVCDRRRLDRLLQPMEIALAGLPKITIAPDEAERVRQGQAIILKPGAADSQGLPDSQIAADQPIVIMAQRHAVALARLQDGELKPQRVFHSAQTWNEMQNEMQKDSPRSWTQNHYVNDQR